MTTTQWNNITDYFDSVGTTDTVFPFKKTQNMVSVTNKGNANLIYSIGSQISTLTPGQTVTVSEKMMSFTIRSASGIQPFQVYATEDGTQRIEEDSQNAQQVNPLRKRLVTFGTGTATTWNTSVGNLIYRVPFQVPKKGKRFRFRLHNYNLATGTVGVGSSLTLTGVAIGKANLDGSSNPDGNFSVPPIQVIQSTVMPPDGSIWYSPWIDIANVDVLPGDLALVSYGVLTSFTGGMQWARSVFPVFYKSGTATTEVAAQTITIAGTSPAVTDFSIQWETLEGQPSTLFFGDSITEGSQGYYQSFPNLFGQTTNSAVSTTAMSGGTVQLLASYPVTAPLWEKVGLTTYTPDTAMIFIGTNDLNSARTSAQIQADITTVFNLLKSAGVKRIFGATIIPRFTGGYLSGAISAGATSFTSTYNPGTGNIQIGSTASTIETVNVTSVTGSGTFTINTTATTKAHAAGELFSTVNSFEYNRINLNIWLRANSLGFVRVFDFDALLKDPTNGTILNATYDGGDHIHPNVAGYNLMVTMIKGIAIP